MGGDAAGSENSQFHCARIIDYAQNAMGDLLSYLTRQLPEALEFLEKMVALESPSFDKPLVDEFVRFVGARFATMGAQVEFPHADKFGAAMISRYTDRPFERLE